MSTEKTKPAQRKFEAEEVVVLRSGGPKMFVLEQVGRRTRCFWFDEAGKKQYGYFDAACLDVAI